MVFIYHQKDRYYQPVNPENCKASVSSRAGWMIHQCSRKIWKDGWCKQHHPESIAERDRKTDERYETKRANSVYGRLERCQAKLTKAMEILIECEKTWGCDCPYCDRNFGDDFESHADDCKLNLFLKLEKA